MPAGRAPVPGSIPLAAPIDHSALMLLGIAPRPFASPEWGWEIKFDGFRVLAFGDRAGAARLVSRNGRDMSAAFPEVIESLSAIRCDVVLDGELTVLDQDGRPDWHALRPRAVMSNPVSIRTAVKRRPATLYLFDMLARDKRDLRPATLVARRKALCDTVESSPTTVKICDLWDDGVALLKAVTEHGLEGIVGKKLDSSYLRGRNRCWLKVRASTAREQTRR